MTTPVYSNASTSFPEIEYYTQFDPYFYTVDNRPLLNLSSVDAELGKSVDAANRSGLMTGVALSALFKDLYGTSSFITGLELSNPSNNVVRVGSGAMYQLANLTASDTRQVIKQAVLPSYKDLTILAPLTVGQSITYLIEGKYVPIDTTNTTSTFPFYDATNTKLPSVTLHGELQVQAVAGVAATTGTQTAPSPTAGWTPLYVVTVDYAGVTYYNEAYAANAPASKGLSKVFETISNLTSTSSSVGDTPVTAFANGSTQGALLKLPVTSDINIYKPVKVKINYSPSITGGEIIVRLKYQIFNVVDPLTPTSYTVASSETMSITAVGNSLASYTMTASIPGYLLSGKSFVNIVLERIGGDGADTNTGVLNVVNAIAFQ